MKLVWLSPLLWGEPTSRVLNTQGPLTSSSWESKPMMGPRMYYQQMIEIMSTSLESASHRYGRSVACIPDTCYHQKEQEGQVAYPYVDDPTSCSYSSYYLPCGNHPHKLLETIAPQSDSINIPILEPS